MRGLTNSTLDSAVLNYLIEKNKQGIIDKHGDISDWDVSDAALATTAACTLLFILLSGVNHLSHAKDASIHKKRFYGAASLAVSGGVVLYKWGAF